MRIAALAEALASDLAALGSLGDETTADVSRRLAAAMEGPIAARLLETLGQVAADLDRAVPGARVELRLVGADVDLVLIEDDRGMDPPEAEPVEAETDASARITLRLPAQLKSDVEQASARQAVSVNTWIVRALAQQARSDGRSGPRTGRRLTGYGRS